MSEGLVGALWREAGTEIPATFPRMTYAEAMERYGSDKPDTRYALEIFDASEVFRGVGFAITTTALDAGGRVRGIRVPGGAALSRKQVDEIESEAKKGGAAGLLRLKFVNGALRRTGGEVPCATVQTSSSDSPRASSRCSSPGRIACPARRWTASGRTSPGA